MTVPAWHDAQGWAALLDATPSSEDRAEMLRERAARSARCRRGSPDGTEYLRLDLPVPGLTIEALIRLLRRAMEAGVPLMAFSVPGGSDV